jgi:hypothetical protein
MLCSARLQAGIVVGIVAFPGCPPECGRYRKHEKFKFMKHNCNLNRVHYFLPASKHFCVLRVQWYIFWAILFMPRIRLIDRACWFAG